MGTRNGGSRKEVGRWIWEGRQVGGGRQRSIGKLEEGAERIFLQKKTSQAQEEGEGEKSLTHPKLPHRQVPIKKSKTGFFGWCVRGYWVTQARAYMQRSVLVFNNCQLYQIRSCDLHAGNIRRAMSEIASYHERDQLSPFSWFLGAVCLLTFLWPSLFVCLPCVIVLVVDLLLHFCGGFKDQTFAGSP